MNQNMVIYNENELQAVANGIAIIDNEINKKYMHSIVEDCKAVPIDIQSAIKLRRQIKLRKIDKIVLAKGEDINQKLTGVYNSLHHFRATLLVYLHGTKSGVELYFGVKGTEGTNANAAIDILEKSLEGNFPGSKIVEVDDTTKIDFLEENLPIEETVKTISTVYAVPSLQNSDGDTNESSEGYTQGIEKFIDTMAGEEYTAVFICEPINRNRLQKYKRDLEQFYTDLSMIDQFELSYSANENLSFAKTVGTNMSKTIGNSTSIARSRGESRTKGGGSGSSRGGNFLAVNWSSNESSNWSDSWNSSSTETDTDQESRTDGTSVANTVNATTGTSQSYSSTVEIKSVIEYMKKIEGLLSRIEKAESYGMWETAGYFISTDSKVSRIGAAVYKSLITGENSHLEPSFSNVWDWEDSTGHDDKQIQISLILKYLHCGNHPVFRENSEKNYNETDFSFIRASNLVSGSELPIFVGLPRKSVAGVTALTYADFGRNVVKSESDDVRRFDLGCIHHMGKSYEKESVELTVNSFDKHCFICGTTGSGKSNTIYHILKNLVELNESDKKRDGSCSVSAVKFLVVEPAKGEYKKDFGGIPGINIFTTNPRLHEMLKLNPFSFPDEVHVLEHLDRLIEIFSACWPLYAAMPAVLKESFERSYQEVGWDLKNSQYLHGGVKKFPTFNTILNLMPTIIDDYDFGAEAKGNYKGALCTRVASLTKGITGMIFSNSVEIDDEILFNQNTIVDISRVGSSETKSLIMGILVLKLNEFRMCEGKGSNLPLRHVTVLEEAHNLLKRVSTEQGQESSNVAGKSVEMIANSIAEMRTYGEGFIIVDQTPSAVADSVISNTSTKIIMRLSDFSDCETMGKSVSLNDEQIKEISRLDLGVAVVFQSDWDESVLCKIDRYNDDYKAKDIELIRDIYAIKKSCGKLVSRALELWRVGNVEELKLLYTDIEGLGVSLSVVTEYKTALTSLSEKSYSRLAIATFVSVILDGLYVVEMFKHILPPKLEIKKDADGKPSLTENGHTQYDYTDIIRKKLLQFCDALYNYARSSWGVSNTVAYECIYCILIDFVYRSEAVSEHYLRECCYKLYTEVKNLKKVNEEFYGLEQERKS